MYAKQVFPRRVQVRHQQAHSVALAAASSKRRAVHCLGITGLAIAVMLLLSSAAHAATKAHSAASPDFYDALGGASDAIVDVEVNKGKTVKLSAPAASVAVANPAIADVQVVSPTTLFVNGIGVGQTSIMAVDASENVILQGTVNVTHNLSSLNRAAHAMAPNAHITTSSVDNGIVLHGDSLSPVESEKLQRLASGYLQNTNQHVINLIDTAGSDQVMLKVRIVELARSEIKRFGINWEGLLNSGNFIFGLAQGRDVTSAGSFLRDTTNSSNSLFAGASGGSYTINTAIDALQNDGLATVLAEPNLTTRSGTPANFLAGGEIPIPVPGQLGTVTIEYRQFGVSLQFTPIVLSKDKISLTVLPEVSALSNANAITGGAYGTIPSITTRRASTTVDLGSGQTFAIAGLLRNDQSNQISKFPLLGDVPILGALFRSSAYQNDQTELVILVTPYIVKPVNDPTKIATPLDGYKPATDGERILLGKLSGSTPEKPDSNIAGQPKSPANIFNGVGGQTGFLLQ